MFFNQKNRIEKESETVCDPVQLYQEEGSGDGEGLLVEIGAAEQQQDVGSVLGLVELEQLSQFPQLLQV